MKKGLLVGLTCLTVLAFPVPASAAGYVCPVSGCGAGQCFTEGYCGETCFTDANGDGICDNHCYADADGNGNDGNLFYYYGNFPRYTMFPNHYGNAPHHL